HKPRYTYTYRYRYRYTQIHTLAVAMGRCPSDEGDTTRHAQKHNRLLCLKCVWFSPCMSLLHTHSTHTQHTHSTHTHTAHTHTHTHTHTQHIHTHTAHT